MNFLAINALDWSPEIANYILRLAVATILGLLIGIERSAHAKQVGMRTHAIVALSSSLLMIISKYAFADSANFDSSRVAAGVIAGIGFLGAAIITYRRDALHGSTTAAGIFATAAIGLSIGSGMFVTGIVATLVLILIQYALRFNRYILRRSRKCLVKVQADLSKPEYFEEVKKEVSISKITKLRTEKKDGKTIGYIDAFSSEYLSENRILQIMNESEIIHSLELIEEYSQQ